MSTLYDGTTGLVIEDSPHRLRATTQGFGPAVKLLDTQPFPLAPWRTPELAATEMEIQGTKGA